MNYSIQLLKECVQGCDESIAREFEHIHKSEKLIEEKRQKIVELEIEKRNYQSALKILGE